MQDHPIYFIIISSPTNHLHASKHNSALETVYSGIVIIC